MLIIITTKEKIITRYIFKYTFGYILVIHLFLEILFLFFPNRFFIIFFHSILFKKITIII